MKKVITYLLSILLALLAFSIANISYGWPSFFLDYKLWIQSALFGGLGGCVYCLRSVYINACVNKNWDREWELWYYLRPIVSIVCGFVSCLLVKAGLLVAEASQNADSTCLGFYALAFIAGLNVDNFMKKVEDIAHATWGIEKSRVAKSADSSKDR